MHKVFEDTEELLSYAREDKRSGDRGQEHKDRYPLRFVLLEDYAALKEFTDRIDRATNEGQEKKDTVYTLNVDSWLDTDCPETPITSTELAKKTKECIKSKPPKDIVIVSFSELARFYADTELEALIKTISRQEPADESQRRHLRIYIPMIGMQSQMLKYAGLADIYIWQLGHKGQEEGQSKVYRLVLTPGTTYGVQGLEGTCTICKSLKDWLELWQEPERIASRIICPHKQLYNAARSKAAEGGRERDKTWVDDAFRHTACDNAYEFLTKGLEAKGLRSIAYQQGDEENWQALAEKVDINGFELETFMKSHFGKYDMAGSKDFAETWFGHEERLDRWLLKIWYQKTASERTAGRDYLCKILQKLEQPSTQELFGAIALEIFGEQERGACDTEQRKELLAIAAKHGVQITDQAEKSLKKKLEAIANDISGPDKADPDKGCRAAAKLMTPLTGAEKELMIEWVGQGRLRTADIEHAYPELASYLQPKPMNTPEGLEWVNDYIDQYRRQKIGNKISDKAEELLAEKNGSPAKFWQWRNEVKTVNTILSDRPDIDVVYWIDGLGIDWLPFIEELVEERAGQGMHLNEVHLAAAELPTRTQNNKRLIEAAAGERLKKIGDLDTYAHKQKQYPDYIAQELQTVKEAIGEVLSKYSGKKIAIVSDHGISYLAQLREGMNLGGVDTDHDGRVATIEGSGKAPAADNNYIALEDGRTLCALGHKGLGQKVPSGKGAHGGATPEEVLVPIIIVSGQENASNYTATIESDEIVGNNPVAVFTIKGLTTVDMPEIEYNGKTYPLKRTEGDRYESGRMDLKNDCKTIELKIGKNYRQSFEVELKTEAEEEDLFGDL